MNQDDKKGFWVWYMGNKSFIYAMIENVVIENDQVFYEFEGGDKIPEAKCFLTMREIFKNK